MGFAMGISKPFTKAQIRQRIVDELVRAIDTTARLRQHRQLVSQDLNQRLTHVNNELTKWERRAAAIRKRLVAIDTRSCRGR